MQRWITVAIAAAALAATGLAQADDHRGHGDRHADRGSHQSRGGQESRGSHRDSDRGSYQYRGGHDFRGRHESWHPAPRYEPRYGYSSHARPDWRAPRYHAWSRGSYLPRAYFGPRYIVRDYGYYGLRRPPAGFGWVRVDGDFLLAALATGFVADALLGGY